ncbi:hypothetical protein PR048_009071 [Dryococelus australis]|uniref:Uncharacterized protein n=1 Tax=Dryococelus australis TaxID=614101 RepID=A0ABQ9HYV3_9NEOP|nr:hypothetical protein PR048_009071 [Dryococelus australis]
MADGHSTKRKSSDPDLEARHRVRTAAGMGDSDLSELPTTLKLKTYIPKSLLCRQGIFYGVPLEYTIRDIQEGIECPNFQVIEIICITKLIREGDNAERVPIKLLTLAFAEQVLPSE